MTWLIYLKLINIYIRTRIPGGSPQMDLIKQVFSTPKKEGRFGQLTASQHGNLHQ